MKPLIYTKSLHECESIPLAFEDVDGLTCEYFADHKGTNPNAFRIIPPRAIFDLIMRCYDITCTIMHGESNAAVK